MGSELLALCHLSRSPRATWREVCIAEATSCSPVASGRADTQILAVLAGLFLRGWRVRVGRNGSLSACMRVSLFFFFGTSLPVAPWLSS